MNNLSIISSLFAPTWIRALSLAIVCSMHMINVYAQQSEDSLVSEDEMLSVSQRVALLVWRMELFEEKYEQLSSGNLAPGESAFSMLKFEIPDDWVNCKIFKTKSPLDSIFTFVRCLRLSTHPTPYITAFNLDGSFYLISGYDVSDFDKMIQNSNIDLHSTSLAVEVAKLFIEVTRHSTTFQLEVVDSANVRQYRQFYADVDVPGVIHRNDTTFVTLFFADNSVVMQQFHVFVTTKGNVGLYRDPKTIYEEFRY